MATNRSQAGFNATPEAKISRDVSPLWKEWFNAKSEEQQSRWRKPAEDVENFINQRILSLKLSSDESRALKEVGSMSDFLVLNDKTQEKWAQKRGAKARDTLQDGINTVKSFADTWDSLATAVLSVAPFGAGGLAWGLAGALLTLGANKHQTENMLSENFSKLSKILPRVDRYQELYPTETMAKTVFELYGKVMSFLWEMFVYFKRSTSGLHRLRIALFIPTQSNAATIFKDIEELSRDIRNDGEIELSKELRQTKCIVETLEEKLDNAERFRSEDDLERIKVLFVHTSTYNLQEISEAAEKEISSIPRTEAEKQAYRSIQRHPDFEAWSTITSGATESKANKILWLCSPKNKRGISQIVTDTKESLLCLKPRPAVVYSFSRPKTIRNGTVLFKECIYQLLLHQPGLVRSQKEVEQLRNRVQPLSMSLEGLAKLLRGLLSALSTIHPVFWIIDCFDEVEFKGTEDLDTVMVQFQSCVMGEGNRLRILLVSAHTPESIDRTWDHRNDESAESCVVGGVRMICWRL